MKDILIFCKVHPFFFPLEPSLFNERYSMRVYVYFSYLETQNIEIPQNSTGMA